MTATTGRVPRVLVISSEPVGARMAGPAIRALELARALAATCTVTLAAPAPSELGGEQRIALLPAGLADYAALLAAIRSHDVVVAQLLPARLLAQVWRGPQRLVVDLYNPTVVEVLEATRGKPPGSRARLRAIAARAAAAHLAAADLVLCASERQRDLWLGGLGLAGELPDTPDPALRDYLAVVPFGVPAEPPDPAAGPALRDVVPGIGAEARVLLWGGGIWDWLDAETAIRATARLADRSPAVHLVFPGVHRPALAARDEHAATARAMTLARELGLDGRRVHFNPGWIPYAERGRWLLESDLGLSCHLDHLEARFAYRTRIADYLWAGLPVLATTGDALGERVAAEGAGRTVAPGDDAALAAAAAELLDDDLARRRCRSAAAGLAEALRWDRVVAPLAAFCAHGAKRPVTAARRRRVAAATLGQYPAIARETLATDGPGALAHRLARNALRASRPGR